LSKSRDSRIGKSAAAGKVYRAKLKICGNILASSLNKATRDLKNGWTLKACSGGRVIEDPQLRSNSAFKHGERLGWSCQSTSEQPIRLLFDEPKNLRQIMIRFSEPSERTQQFTLRGADSPSGLQRVVRQPIGFNPGGFDNERRRLQRRLCARISRGINTSTQI